MEKFSYSLQHRKDETDWINFKTLDECDEYIFFHNIDMTKYKVTKLYDF